MKPKSVGELAQEYYALWDESRSEPTGIELNTEAQIQRYSDLFGSCCEIVKRIRLLLKDVAIPVVPGDREADLIRRIAAGRQHPVEELTREMLKEFKQPLNRAFSDLLSGRLEPEDRASLVAEHLGIEGHVGLPEESLDKFFWPLYDESEAYVTRLLESGNLVLTRHQFPPHLGDYVWEARRAYAHGNYLSVFIICRTILQIGLNDIDRRRRNEPVGRWPEYLQELGTSGSKGRIGLIDELFPAGQFPTLNKRLTEFNRAANGLVHPKSPGKIRDAKDKAESSLRTLMDLLHEAYDAYV